MRHGVKTCCRNENFLRHFNGKSEACEKIQDNSITEEIIKQKRGNVDRIHNHRADVSMKFKDLTDKQMLRKVFRCQ